MSPKKTSFNQKPSTFGIFDEIKRYQNKKSKNKFSVKRLVLAVPHFVVDWFKVYEPRWRTSLALLIFIAIIASAYFTGSSFSLAASFTFSQSSWVGGVSATNATHPGDQTGWNKYSTSTSTDLSGDTVKIGTFSNSTSTDPSASTQANAANTSVTSATLAVTDGVSAYGSTKYEMTNDGGSTWGTVKPGTSKTFSSGGTNLQWRATPYSASVPTVVQSVTGDSTGGTTATVTLSNVTPGNLIVVAMNGRNATSLNTSNFTFSDDKSNTYTTAIATKNGVANIIKYAKNVTGGTTSISVVASSAGQTFNIAALEIAGAGQNNPLAGVDAINDSNATSHPCGSGISTPANVFVLCAGSTSGAGVTPTAATGYTRIDAGSAAFVYQFKTSSTALFNETATWASTGQPESTNNVMVVFKTGGTQAPAAVRKSLATSSSGSAALTLDNVVSGNAVVVGISQTAGFRTYTVTDTTGNTYSNVFSNTSLTNISGFFYVAKNVTGGSLTITITQAGGAATYFEADAFELAGADTLNPYDQSTSYQESVDSNSHTCANTSSGTGINTTANVWIYCMSALNSTAGVTSSTAGSSYTSAGNTLHFHEYRTSDSPLVAHTGPWTHAGTARSATSYIASFKAAVHAPYVLQKATSLSSGSTPASASVTLSGVTAGNLLAVTVVNSNSAFVSDTNFLVSDNRSDSYTLAANNWFGTRKIQILYAKNVTGGSTTVTVNAPGNGTYSYYMTAYEIAGADATTPVDTSGTYSSTTGTSVDCATGGLNTSANSLIICAGLSAGAGTVNTYPSNYTVAYTNNSNSLPLVSMYRSSPSPLTSEKGTFIISQASAVMMGAMISFKASFSTTITYSGTYTQADLTSSAFNSGDAGNLVAKVAWTATNTSGSQTVKLQIRTSTDGNTWSNWCGMSDTGSSCTGNNYFTSTDNGVNLATTNPIRSGNDDQWFQYKITLNSTGLTSPAVSNVTITYVVNTAPDFNPTNGLTAAQVTDTSDSNLNKVAITYSIRDVDSTNGSVNAGFITPSFEYNIGGGWVAITSTYLNSGALNNKAVDETNYTDYTAYWDAKTQIPTQYLTAVQVRATITDNEAANSSAQSTSSAFTVDTTNPSVTTSKIDGSLGTITIAATDDTNLSYRLSNNSDLSADGLNATSGQWVAAGGNSISVSPSWIFAAIPNHPTVYMQIRDRYGNTVSQTLVAPNTPSSMYIKDISSPDNNQYREFVSWSPYTAVASAAFLKYEIYRSTDGSNFSLQNTITDGTVNYYADFNLSQDVTYYYKVRILDTDTDISGLSEAVSDVANGQGGSDATAPVITNVMVSNTNATFATITWTTDELSNSMVDYSVSPSTLFGLGQSSNSYVTSHTVTLTNLIPNTTYLFQVRSTDAVGNIGVENNDGAGYSFTTAAGPVISGVTETSVDGNSATIFWTTDLDSDSHVTYSSDLDFDPSTTAGSDALVGGSNPYQHQVSLSGLTSGTTYYYYVTSKDSDNNTSTDNNAANYYSFTTTTDNNAPVISGVSTPVIAPTAAVVVWQTDELATTQLIWGTTSGDLDQTTVLDSTLTIFHIVSLSGLEENKEYFFQAKSKDSSDNESTSDESSFTTGETTTVVVVAGGGGGGGPQVTLDKTPPQISEITTNNVKPFTADIAFKTNEDSLGIVLYGTDKEKLTSSSAALEYGQDLTVSMGGLRMGTDYYYKVKAIDKAGNETVSDVQQFTTKFFTESTIGISDAAAFQKEVEDAIEAALPSLVPPFIEKPQATNVTDSSATITWRTNVKTYSVVNYAGEDEYDSSKTDNPYATEVSDTGNKVTDHEMVLSNLKPNTRYHFRVKAFSLPQLVGQSNDLTFVTKALSIQAQISEVTNNSFAVSWRTADATTSVVEYRNTKTGITNQKSLPEQSTSHQITVDGLNPATTYDVSVYGINAKGNRVQTASSLKVTTSQDTKAPEILSLKIDTAIVPGRNDRTQTIVSWKTNEPSTSTVMFEEGATGDKDKPLANKVEITNSLVLDHAVVLTVLKPGGLYRIQIASTDSAGNTTTLPVKTIVVPRQSESILDVIFKNFEDTFKFLRQVGK